MQQNPKTFNIEYIYVYNFQSNYQLKESRLTDNISSLQNQLIRDKVLKIGKLKVVQLPVIDQ